MRIGIDVQQLAHPARSGLHIYAANLLTTLGRTASRDRIVLFMRHMPAWRAHVDAIHSEIGSAFPIRRYGVPWPPYQLRLRFNAIHRMDVFYYLSEASFPTDERRASVFMIPDLTPVHLPHHHADDIRRHWEGYFEKARRHSDGVITYSEHTRQDVSATLGIPLERITAIPLAAEDRFGPIEDRATLRNSLEHWGLEDGNYLLSVGTLEPRKNHTLLLDAWAALRSRKLLPPRLRLVFSGAIGWLNEPLAARIGALGLEDDVLLLGHADPLDHLYNGALATLYPSLFEGFGLPPLEAMACGVPVIASNATSLPEVAGDAAVLVDPHDVEAWAEAMHRVIEDRQFRDELRSKGLRQSAQFSWARTAAETLLALRAAARQ